MSGTGKTAVVVLLALILALAATGSAGAKQSPEVAFVHRWSASYDTFARTFSASVSACFPTNHPHCAPAQLRASTLVAPLITALRASVPPPALEADVSKLESGLRTLRTRLVASARHPASGAFCRGEIGPCTPAVAVITDAITDLTNITQLQLPIPD